MLTDYLKELKTAIITKNVKEQERIFKALRSLGMDKRTAIMIAAEVED